MVVNGTFSIGVEIDPIDAQPGEQVNITTTFTNLKNTFIGYHMHYLEICNDVCEIKYDYGQCGYKIYCPFLSPCRPATLMEVKDIDVGMGLTKSVTKAWTVPESGCFRVVTSIRNVQNNETYMDEVIKVFVSPQLAVEVQEPAEVLQEPVEVLQEPEVEAPVYSTPLEEAPVSTTEPVKPNRTLVALLLASAGIAAIYILNSDE